MTIQSLALNMNMFDEDKRVFKNIIQENFNLIELKLKELLLVEYNLPTISDVNDITVNDITSIQLDTPLGSVFNLKSFIDIYKMNYIPYDLVRHNDTTFSFNFLDVNGVEHSINNYTCENSEVNRYLVLNTVDNTVSNISGVNATNDYVIAFYDYNVSGQQSWVFNIEPYPFKKSIIETLIHSWTESVTKDVLLPPNTGEFDVYKKNDKGYSITSTQNSYKFTEGI